MTQSARTIQDAANEAMIGMQTFPPSFQENAAAYGFALFGLVVVSSLSLSRIVMLSRALDINRHGWSATVTTYRVTKIMLYLTLLLSTLPDVIVLLLWNEVSLETMLQLWSLDRVIDGLALVPFMGAIFLALVGETRLKDALIRDGGPTEPFSSLVHIKRSVWIILIVALAALLIVVGKVAATL